MKKSILYILFALFSLSAAVSLTACKDDGVEISGANKSKTPKNVKLLEYGPTSLTICWDFIRGATSYTVQLVDGEMNPVSEALCKTTDAIDYHEFTDLATDRIYYGRVRANFPYSSTSDWVYVTANEQPAMLMASVGILELDPKLTLNAATGSTLTYEWSYTEDAATDATRLYNIELFRDEACSELHVSWLADGKLASDKGIFTALAGYPVVRFTFSGLDPETTYYARVTNASFGNIMTPVVAGTTAKAGPEASPNNPAQAGDIVLAQDFAAFIHGGDIVRSAAGYNAVSGTDYRKAWEPATGENPQADGDRPVCNWATEFHIHTGGTSAEYVESLGMTGWGSSGNTSTRPGYIKCGGGGGGIGILYTPELAALPKNTTVTVSFSASAYAEGENVYGSDIVVEAIEGAEFGSNNSVSKKGTAVASKVVDISSAVGRFETFTVTLDGLSPTSRIAFSSNPAQAGANKTRYLLDDIVVVYDGETKLEKLTVPANVKFDAEAVYSDKLTLEWDEVPGAASYTVAWWADGTEEKDATVAEGITSASYLLKELEAGTEYHAKVKACRYNNPGYDSDYSAVVSQKTDIAPVQAGIVVSKVLATSSTLTVEWARADGQACVNSSAQVYHVKLYSDAECKDLFVGWNASNVFGITAGNRFRFTFSGLAPATTYYVCVDDKTNDFFSDPLAYATAAAGPQAGATAPGSAKAGDILLAEDFSKVIHGGDIANFAAGYYPPSSNRGTYAAASGDNPSGFSATRCTANEFDLFSGGGVAAPYTEGTGLSAWGKSGNIAGRPGYVKMGAGSAAASLYTPELTALPDAATVKVRFSAQAYSEKYDGSGADAGKILVKAVRGAVLGAKGAITGTVTEVSAADPVDISAAKARFREFEATLTNVTPDCRIVISTSEKRALLDNVVVTCTAITPATKPAAPGGGRQADAQMERCPRCDFLHGRLLERFGLSPRKRVCLQDRHRVHGNVAGADQPGKQHLLLGQGQGGRQPRFRLVGNGERHDHGQRRRAAPSDGRPARRGVPQRRFGYGQLLVGNARAADAVIEAVKAKGLTDRVEYIAFDYTTCKRIVNALPGAMVQYLNGDLAPAAVRQDGIGGIDYRFSAYSGNPGWVKEAHANGMVTNVWTVDTVQDMMTCIAWGMDFITTNNPETLKELLTRTFVSAN